VTDRGFERPISAVRGNERVFVLPWPENGSCGLREAFERACLALRSREPSYDDPLRVTYLAGGASPDRRPAPAPLNKDERGLEREPPPARGTLSARSHAVQRSVRNRSKRVLTLRARAAEYVSVQL